MESILGFDSAYAQCTGGPMAIPAVEHLAGRLGLSVEGGGGIRYGILDGYPAQVEPVPQGHYVHLRAILRFEAGTEVEVRHAVRTGALASAAANPKLLHVEGGAAALLVKARIFMGLPKLDAQEARVRALVAALRQVGAAPPSRCAECGGVEKGEPVLLRGRVDRVCPGCIGRLEEKVRANRAAYEARRVNVAGALLEALLASLVGAAAYGAAIAATGRLLWLVPILSGGLIAWAAIRGAGRTSPAVRAIAVVATLFSVIAGLLGYIGWRVHEQAVAHGRAVDWLAFLAAAPQILVDGGRAAVFSLAGGLVGAYGAARRLRTPDFQEVSRA